MIDWKVTRLRWVSGRVVFETTVADEPIAFPGIGPSFHGRQGALLGVAQVRQRRRHVGPVGGRQVGHIARNEGNVDYDDVIGMDIDQMWSKVIHFFMFM